MTPVAILVLTAALTGIGLAQTVEVAATGAAAEPVRFEVGLRDLRQGTATAALHFAVGARAAVGLELRQTDSFGPIGNVIFELGGILDTGGSYQGRIAARGVLGPVALSATLSAFNAPPEVFAPLAFARASRPVTDGGVAGIGLAIDADIRADRDLVIGVTPELYLIDRRLAARMSADVSLLRVAPEVDVVIALHGHAAPGFEAGHAAVGVGAVWRRRRAPAWRGELWLGADPGISLGIAGRWVERFGSTLLSVEGAAQPFRTDLAPYRIEAAAQLPLGEGEADVTAALAYRTGLRAALRLAYRMALER